VVKKDDPIELLSERVIGRELAEGDPGERETAMMGEEGRRRGVLWEDISFRSQFIIRTRSNSN
jgi:hypothetical protein